MAKNYKNEICIIEKKKLIIAEGNDVKYFLIHLLNNKGINDIQVIDSGGIKELTICINSLKNIDGFDDVTSILIFRDAEDSAQSAIESVNYSLRATGLITTDIKPFTTNNQNNLSIGFALFPGIDENGYLYNCGALEHLCLRLFKDNSNYAIIKNYIEDFQTKSTKFKSPHKNELHALFTFTDKYVGLKIGETAKTGGFNFDSPCLLPFLNMINEM